MAKLIHDTARIMNKRLAEVREKMPKSSDRKGMTELKPLFKEWLEIRADYHQHRADMRKLRSSDSKKLLPRCENLTKYLGEVAFEPGVTKRLTDFKAWLMEQVRFGGFVYRLDLIGYFPSLGHLDATCNRPCPAWWTSTRV